ncbi:thiocillin family RiPP [Massilia mucilaginosa]|uniref:thiocillin family RiPP n=1 Tax=Massilia mucilaginosa TaxID=2609282 RepID=UPI00141EB854
MELFTLHEKHSYDLTPEAARDANAAYGPADVPHDQPLTAAFNTAGTAGTFGTAGGCIGTVGSFGSANCDGPRTPTLPI